jgi:hypothetical protein
MNRMHPVTTRLLSAVLSTALALLSIAAVADPAIARPHQVPTAAERAAEDRDGRRVHCAAGRGPADRDALLPTLACAERDEISLAASRALVRE